jgi:1,4-dihydroxy-2-naphthoate octaprenyltransferase
MLRFLRYSLRLRRVEYRIAELPIFLIPMLLVIDGASAFTSPVFWEGLCVFFFLFAFGDLLNCLADRDLDAIYKPHLTEAVDGLGVRGVITQAVVSALAALALTVHLALVLDRWLLVPAVVLGLFIAYAYSVGPFRLKGRGLGQLAFYWLGLFTGPMIFSALLFTSWPSLPVLAVAVAFGMVQTGVILINTAEDYPEDRAGGVRTAIVALGLRRGIDLALVLTLIGGVALLLALALICLERRAPLPVLLLPGLACVGALLGIGSLRRRLRGTEVEDVQAVKKAGKWVPVWITSVAVSCLLAAWFVWREPRPPARAIVAFSLVALYDLITPAPHQAPSLSGASPGRELSRSGRPSRRKRCPHPVPDRRSDAPGPSAACASCRGAGVWCASSSTPPPSSFARRCSPWPASASLSPGSSSTPSTPPTAGRCCWPTPARSRRPSSDCSCCL